MDSNWTLMKDLLADTPSIDVWLSKNLKRGDVVGVDANLLRTRTWNIFSSTLDRSGEFFNTWIKSDQKKIKET